MNVEMQLLEKFLQYAVMGGASGLASFAMEKWEKTGKWPHFGAMSPEVKMYVGYLLTGLVGVAAYFAMMGLLYVPVPQGYVEWIETLVAVGFTAAGVTQIYHRAKSFRSK